jgi:phosphatidylglycerophosphatase A
MLFKQHAVMFFATVGYVGRLPFAPGTFGSLVGIPIVILFSQWRFEIAAVATAALILFAVAVSHLAERYEETKDPGCIVIDEVAGLCVVFLGLPLNVTTCVAGFVLFRFFDIAKFQPVRFMEQRLPGGWGVVMDDVMAGIMSLIVLRAALLGIERL